MNNHCLNHHLAAKLQLWCCYSFGIFWLMFFIGLWNVAGVFPPLNPGMPAESLATLVRENANAMRLGTMIAMFGTVFFFPPVAVLCTEVARIEQGGPKTCTYLALMTGGGGLVTLAMPLMFFCVALFRPDRAPDLILLASDFAWVLFFGMASPFIGFLPAVGISSFLDVSDSPTFPHWFGYYTLAATTTALPGASIIFFHDGVFAWNGFIGFWVTLGDLLTWMVVALWCVHKAVSRRLTLPTP